MSDAEIAFEGVCCIYQSAVAMFGFHVTALFEPIQEIGPRTVGCQKPLATSLDTSCGGPWIRTEPVVGLGLGQNHCWALD